MIIILRLTISRLGLHKVAYSQYRLHHVLNFDIKYGLQKVVSKMMKYEQVYVKSTRIT